MRRQPEAAAETGSYSTGNDLLPTPPAGWVPVVGDRVLAIYADGHPYGATVKAVNPGEHGRISVGQYFIAVLLCDWCASKMMLDYA